MGIVQGHHGFIEVEQHARSRGEFRRRIFAAHDLWGRQARRRPSRQRCRMGQNQLILIVDDEDPAAGSPVESWNSMATARWKPAMAQRVSASFAAIATHRVVGPTMMPLRDGVSFIREYSRRTPKDPRCRCRGHGLHIRFQNVENWSDIGLPL